MKFSIREIWRRYKIQTIVISFLVFFLLALIVHSPEVYLNLSFFLHFLDALPFRIILALALTLIVIEGEIDLSFPSVVTLSAFIFAETLVITNSVVVAFIVALILGVVAGSINGWVISKYNVNSMMWTMGMYFALGGLTLILCQAKYIPILFVEGTLFHQALVGRLFGFPVRMLWAILIPIVLWLLLNRHRFGSSAYLVGDNEDVAIRVGVNVDRVKTITYVIMGACAAFAGVMVTVGAGQFFPQVGQYSMLPVLVAVFIGGTPLGGGRGTILGSFFGVFVLGLIESGVVALGFGGYARDLIFGILLVLSLLGHKFTR